MMSSAQSHPMSRSMCELKIPWGGFIDRSKSLLPSVNTGKEMMEHVLVQALRNGEEAAFCSLIEQYHTRLIRVARAFVSSQAIAEEVVQETWLAVLEGINRFEGRSSLKTWLFRILTNRAKTRGVQEHRYVPLPGETHGKEDSQKPEGTRESLSHDRSKHNASTELPTTCDHNDPETHFLVKEAVTHIESAIQALPPRYQQIILLRDVEGWTSAEVCDLLHLSEGNQRVLLHRARIGVRDYLAPFYQSSDDAPAKKDHVTKTRQLIQLGNHKETFTNKAASEYKQNSLQVGAPSRI